MDIGAKTKELYSKAKGVAKNVSHKAKYGTAMLLAYAGMGIATAKADLMWNIDTTPNIGNFDGDFFNPGDELSLTHVVYNNTAGSDPFDALDEFTLSGGLNQGVFLVSTPANWTYSILDDTTYFSATGPSGEIQPGGNNANFSQYSSKFNYANRDANANSVASGPFDTIQTFSVIPEPAAFTLFGIGGLLIYRELRRKN
ncbi:hypothetical protein H6503_00280 [Candidatus Woesearchaeota archaeon]|nr:hypothetical protein [Candidatus Woesearchaeota archaeon]